MHKSYCTKIFLLFTGIFLFVFSFLPKTFALNNPSPQAATISAGVAEGIIYTCPGMASASPNIAQFPVSGTNLTSNITATAPPGFELSLAAGSGYNNTLTLAQSSGTINNVIVYVRAAATATAGNINGNVVLSSTGAANQKVAVSGKISSLPTVNLVSNQTVNSGVSTKAVNFTGTGSSFTWTNNRPGIGLAASGTGNISSFITVNTGSTPVTADITVTPIPAGFAYITNLNDNTVSVINTTTYQIVSTIPVGKQPIGVAISKDGKTVYVTNLGSNSISVINASSNTVTSTINVDQSPYQIILNPDESELFVSSPSGNTISEINIATGTVINTFAVGANPNGIRLSADGTYLYAVSSLTNNLYVINTATKALIATIPVGITPGDLVISPDGSSIYVISSGSTDISVINTLNNTLTKTIHVGTNLQAICISPDGSKIYISDIGNNEILVYDTATYDLIASILVENQPEGVSLTPDGSRLFTANQTSNTVSVINTQNNTVINTIAVGNAPASIGKFISAGFGCVGNPTTFTITVKPSSTPTITASTVTGNIIGCEGLVSPNIQQFTVSGSGLTANITATAPPGFELSLAAGSGYKNTITLNPSNGVINKVIVYVRAAATAPVGYIEGNVILSAGGSADQSVQVIGMVYALPMVNQPPNQGPLPNGSSTNAVNFVGNTALYNWTNDNPAIGLAASGTGDIPPFMVKNISRTTALTATITVTPVPQTNAYIPNSQSNDVSVINVANNRLVTVIPVGKGPLGVAVSPDGTRAYITNQSSDNISVINTVTNKVVSVITLPAGSAPSGIVVSPDGNLVYVANFGKQSISIINTATNAIIQSIQLNGAFPYEIALSRDGSRLYSPNHSFNGDNNISVINTVTNTVISTMPVGDRPFNACVSPDGLLLYVANTNAGNVIVINTQTNKIVATIKTGAGPWRVITNPDGSRLYVTNSQSNTVSVINTADNSVLKTIDVGGQPFGESFNLDGSRLYVVSASSNLMSVINPVDNKVINTIRLGTYPLGLGNFVMPETGCAGTPVKFSITVAHAEPPLITVTNALQSLQTTYGTPSASTAFTLTGTNMQAGVLVSLPPGFELSTDNITFSNTITVGAAGTIAPTVIYIRLAASTFVGSYTGNVVLSSDGAANASVLIPTSIVTPAPLTITADDKNKYYGQINPPLTVTYQGFKNNDGPAQLTSPPLVTTTAVKASLAGEYPITVSAAYSANYSISYVSGKLIVESAIAVIPNVFSPNNDGINDIWNIQYLNTYTKCSVDIYNRYGTKIYSSIGYAMPWDGRYKGTNLPMGTYYYIINLHNGSPVLSGSVTIIR